LRRRIRCGGLVALAVLTHPWVVRAESTSPWRFEAAAAAWLPAMDGRFDVGELRTPVDIDFGVAVDLLGEGKFGAGAGGFEAHHVPLGVTAYVHAFGVVAKDDEDRPSKHTYTPGFGDLSGGDQDLHQSIAAVEFGLGYRLGEWHLAPGRSVWVEGRAGGRFLHYHGAVNDDFFKIRLIGIATENCADPVLGLRWRVDLLDGLALDATADIGGFGAGTDLSWDLEGVFRYTLPWRPGGSTLFAIGGYKLFSFRWDYDGGFLNAFGGPNPQRGRIDLTLQGPLLGFGVRF
jgi:hypothetical protein